MRGTCIHWFTRTGLLCSRRLRVKLSESSRTNILITVLLVLVKPLSDWDEFDIWQKAYTSRDCFAFGWGSEQWEFNNYSASRNPKLKHPYSYKLKKVHLETLTIAECTSVIPPYLQKYFVGHTFHHCAMFDHRADTTGNSTVSPFGLVNGDTGGPIICSAKTDKKLQILAGVFIFSFTNGSVPGTNLFSIFAPIHLYLDWMMRVMTTEDIKGLPEQRVITYPSQGNSLAVISIILLRVCIFILF